MAQKDLHAYSTLCLAKAAGYSDEDAVLLAWSNIETDYSLQVGAWNCLWSNLGLYFHFIPGNKKDLICQVQSELCKRIADKAFGLSLPTTLGPGVSPLPYDLCARGIALHGLQDSYFHWNWVGKFSRHNVLPAWSSNKFTPSLPFPYGHSPMGRIPDEATATWYDPRTGQTINNRDRVESALFATSQILGLDHTPPDVAAILANIDDYDERKQALRNIVGMPLLKFSAIRSEMLRKYGAAFKAAAKEQTAIVKENI